MLETAVRQVRVALAMAAGRRVNIRLMHRLIDDVLATIAEFGSPGDDVGPLVDGPFADPDERRDVQAAALRRTATALARRSPFYRELFDSSQVIPGRLHPDNLCSLPVTRKHHLVRRPRDFLCGRPDLVTQSSGTTGAPARVWLSRYEAELWPALNALSMLLRGEILPDDCMQISVSSRATANVQSTITMMRLAGSASRVVGQVPPDEAVDHLLDTGGPTPNLLSVYPSYAGELVAAARRRGLGPADFRLRTVFLGGEILSPSLARGIRQTFGPERVAEAFGMTEILPVGGRICTQRHLHQDPNLGYSEVLDIDTGHRAEPGRLGVLTVTPYFPYRECMPVLRYDTRDVVRVLPGEPDCELAGIPAVSAILGKRDRLLRTAAGVVTPREIVEVLDELPGTEWPVRHRASVIDGRLRVTVAAGQSSAGEIVRRFAAHGIEADVDVVRLDRDQARLLCPLRCDLRERTFARGVA